MIATEDPEVTLRRRRAHAALQEAPALVAHIRAKVTDPPRTERGIEVPDDQTPLLTAAADEADALYVLLLDWVQVWSNVLSIMPPATAVVAWRNFHDSHPGASHTDAPLLGFKSGTTHSGAWALVQTLATWLLLAEARITTHELAEQFDAEIAATVWESRCRHGMTKALPARDASERQCPACGALEVRAEFFGSSFTAATLRGEFDVTKLYNRDERRTATTEAGRKILTAVDGVTVRCGACGWSEKPNPRAIVGWLQ
jgi:hypothetical protein